MGMELTRDQQSRGLTEEGIIHIPGLLSRWVRLANGARCHYVTAGETGPAIILLHGGIVGSSGTAGWRFMAPFLGQNGFRVYAPDRPGFGLADTGREFWPERGYQSQVEFVNDFADALGLDKFHLSGNSMGGQITAQYVINHPERIISYALIATNVGDIVEAPRTTGKQSRFTPNPDYAPPVWDGSEQSMQVLMEGIIYNTPEIWPELITMRNRAALLQREVNNHTGSLGAGRGQNTRPIAPGGGPADDPNFMQWVSTKDRLDKITLPGIYLYGLQDVLGPVENGFDQEDVLPNVQMFYPDECGHQGQTDQPELFNQAFLEFFRDGKVSWQTARRAGVSRRRAIDPKYVEQPDGGFPPPDPSLYDSIEKLRAATKVTA